MKPSTVLEKAAKLLQTKGWTQGCSARDKYGTGVSCMSKKAAVFCALGAVWRADTKGLCPEQYLHGVIGTDEIGPWNDTIGRTKRQVIAALRKAAKVAAKAGE